MSVRTCTRSHEREGAAADGGHRGGAVRLEDVGHDADRVGEALLGREHLAQRPLGEGAVADLATAGAAEELHLAHRERREVVVEHEALAVLLLLHGVDDLRVLGGAEGGGHEGLRLAAGEEGRPVRAREDTHLARDLPDLVEPASVEAVAVLEDLALQQLLAQRVVDGREGGLLLRLVLGDRGDVLVLDLLHPRLRLELALRADGLEQRLGQGALDLGHDAGVVDLLRVGSLGLADARAKLLLDGHDLPDDAVALDEGLRQDLLGDLGGAGLDHHDRVLGAGHQQVQLALGLEVGVGGVDDELVVPVADPHGADRVLERDVRDVERGRGADDRERVGVVLHVRREQQADHLRLARVALGEERPQRPVDHAGGQDLLLVRPALALEEAAGDLAAGVVALAVVDREGKEIEADARLALRAGGRENDGVAQAHQHRAVGLLRHPPCLEGQGVAAQGQFQSFHALSLSASAGARARGTPGTERSWTAGRHPERPPPGTSLRVRLLADAELADENAVAARVLALQVLQEAPTLPDELQEPAPGVVVLGMRLEVLREIADPLAEEGHLNLGRPGVRSVEAVSRNDIRLLGRAEAHRLTSS
jgi:hypothetical protein